MSDQFSPRQQLILWLLAAAGGGEWNPNIKPELKKPDRDHLLQAGLIQADKRKLEGPGRSKSLLFICLTEKGWAWLSRNVEIVLPNSRTNMKETLQRLLSRLKAFLDVKRLSLAEFISPSPDGASNPSTDLEPRITSAYYQLSGGQPNVRVHLADLRSSLEDVPRQELDRALLALATEGRASLYCLDDPQEVQGRDREAVLLTPSGEERHIIYLGGPGS